MVLYACIPDGVPAFATTCVTAFAGAALLFVPFRARLAAAVRAGGLRFVAAVLGLAVLSASYNTLYLFGSKAFDVASGAFTFCMTVVVLPVVLLTMRRRVALETWISVALVLAGIVERVELTPRIAIGAALVVAGSIAEIADFRGRRRARERERGLGDVERVPAVAAGKEAEA